MIGIVPEDQLSGVPLGGEMIEAPGPSMRRDRVMQRGSQGFVALPDLTPFRVG
jgi:hypothetical protein